MIATILPSSANFHAVEYNERKVAQGKAELLEMSNFGYVTNMGTYTWEDIISYLKDYTSRTTRIKRVTSYPSRHRPTCPICSRYTSTLPPATLRELQ